MLDGRHRSTASDIGTETLVASNRALVIRFKPTQHLVNEMFPAMSLVWSYRLVYGGRGRAFLNANVDY